MYKQESNLSEAQGLAPAPIDIAVAMAERELAAFYRAVNVIFGKAEAAMAAEEWIREAGSLEFPLRSRKSDWRHVTIRASRRLAQRRAA